MPPPNRASAAKFLEESLNLQKALAGGLTPEDLSGWAENNSTRQAVLTDTVWGQIRWPKSLGRPLSPTLAAGFAASHDYHYVKYEQTGPDDYIEQDVWAPRATPLTWDGPADPDDYVVSYFADAVAGWPNRITVGLANGVFWSVADVRGYRLVDPPSQIFEEVGEHVELPDFTVSVVSYLGSL